MSPSNEPEERAQLNSDESVLELSLIIRDGDVVAHARGGGLGDEPIDAAKSLYRLGVIVSTTSRLDATVQEARRMHDGLLAISGLPDQIAARVKGRVGEQLAVLIGDPNNAGALQQAVDVSVNRGAEVMRGQLKPVVDQLVGAGPDALPQLIEQRLRSAVTESTTAFQKQLFATNSPLTAHLKQHAQGVVDLRGEMAELRKEMAAQIAQLLREQLATIVDPATAGRDWEPATLDAVAGLTSVTGDRLEITGDQPGHGRSKKGDGVLHLAADGRACGVRVAVECRTGTSKRVTLADLSLAAENRAAHAALLLAQHPEGLPRDAQKIGFRVYPDERCVVAVYEPEAPESQLVLGAAIQIARTLARLAAQPGNDNALERELLRDAVQKVEAAFAQIRPLRSAASGVERELGRIRECVDRIAIELTAAINELAGISEAA